MPPNPTTNTIARDGDVAFYGLQSRRNPLVIKEGYLQVSRNMRLDRAIGQTRKGCRRLANGISIGATPVTVPFVLHAGDPVTSITQSGNVATVTTSAPHGLGSVGNQFYVEIAGVTGATASAYNGKFTVTVTGSNTFTYPVSGSPASNPPGIITWAWPVLLTNYSGGIFGGGVYSSPRYDYSNEYIVLCGPTSAYLYRQGSSLLNLSYPTSPIAEQILPGDIVNTLQAFDRLYLFRWRPSELKQKVTSIVQSTTSWGGVTFTASGSVIAAVKSGISPSVGQWITITGLTGTSAPLNGTWQIATVTATGFTFSIGSAPNLSVLSVTALSAASTTATAICANSLSAGDSVTIAGASIAGYNGTFSVLSASSTQFTYTVAAGLGTPTGTITATPLLSASTVNAANGTATVTTPVAHGYAVGEVVRLSGSDQSGFNLDAIIATVPTSTTFTVAVPSATASNTSASLFAQRVQCPLVWDGITSGFVRVPTGTSPLGPTYSRMVSPTGGIATYYNNQVVICNGRDTLLVSDVLDPDTYDPMLKGFRTNTGSNDYLVALHPYADRQIIAFLRKSIYLGTLILASDGVSLDTTQSRLELLTTEVGCSARMTVATAGNFVYFLADQGVYRLDNSNIDLALRGNTLPLSEPIADIVATINQAAVGTSNAVYFNNRYYLAVPTGTATSPNTLLIYNQLNEAWESVDTELPALDRLVVSDYGTTRRLFAISNAGSVFLLEEDSSGKDDTGTGTAQSPINGTMTTRRYFYGELARKRLGNLAVSAFLPSGSTINVQAVTTDPDNTSTVASVTNTGADNDYTIRAPIRRPGTYLDLTVTTSGGRPIIRSISADASIPVNPSTLARTDS